jgi:cytoskeletal protein RodZ
MEEIGKLLREVREEKGLTLDDISRETKIQKKYLSALEEGDFSLFSGEIYIKGALRNYAQAVGINVSEILSLYSQFKEKYNFEVKNDRNKTKKEQSIFFSCKEKKPFPSVALIWIILLTFVVGGSIWYLYGQGSKKETKAPYPEGYLLEDVEKQEEPAPQDVVSAEKPKQSKAACQNGP